MFACVTLMLYDNDMFYGFTESESFDDPTILNTYPHHKVVIERRPDGKGYWHIFILRIDDESLIEKTVKQISASLKPDWNAVFYNEHKVYCIFKNKIFIIPRKKTWSESDYAEVKTHALAVDVGPLDLNDMFKHYNDLLAKP